MKMIVTWCWSETSKRLTILFGIVQIDQKTYSMENNDFNNDYDYHKNNDNANDDGVCCKSLSLKQVPFPGY